MGLTEVCFPPLFARVLGVLGIYSAQIPQLPGLVSLGECSCSTELALEAARLRSTGYVAAAPDHKGWREGTLVPGSLQEPCKVVTPS